MTKPMYCPMSFPALQPFASTDMANVCTPDCAWAVKTEQCQFGCSIPQMCASTTYMNVALNLITNARPLKDDEE